MNNRISDDDLDEEVHFLRRTVSKYQVGLSVQESEVGIEEERKKVN